MQREAYLECGKVLNTHGLRGDMKMESYCDTPEVLRDLRCIYRKKGGEYLPYSVRRAVLQKGFVLMHLDGVESIDDAQLLKNTVFYAKREDLPLEEGAHFISDLIGLPVIDAESGRVYGVLRDVSNLGASDLYIISTEQGERMMPAVDEFVDRIEEGEGIYIRPIEGMFD